MNRETGLSIAVELMREFAGLTGLSPAGEKPRRYLWTDAFVVCNFLELHRQTNDAGYMDLALLLVDQVHGILGRHRAHHISVCAHLDLFVPSCIQFYEKTLT